MRVESSFPSNDGQQTDIYCIRMSNCSLKCVSLGDDAARPVGRLIEARSVSLQKHGTATPHAHTNPGKSIP